MMRALQLVEPGILALADIEILQIGPDDVLLEVHGPGPCHSDIHVRHLPIALFDVSPERLQATAAHGAYLVLSDDAAAADLDATDGRGADTTLDFVGSQRSADLAVSTVAPDGNDQFVGIAGGQPRVVAEPRMGDGWPYGAAVRTSCGGTRSDLVECVALAQAGRLTIDAERFALADGITAFDRSEAGTINGRAILVP